MALLRKRSGDRGKAADADQPPEEGGAKPTARKGDAGDRVAARPRGARVAQLRTRLAQLVWLLFVVAALVLAVGALCIALGANRDNSLVRFVLDGANVLDLGIFSRQNGIKSFGGDNAGIKNALFNWGLGAVLYLVVGRIVERIIRP